jgi:hypothetical protein
MGIEEVLGVFVPDYFFANWGRLAWNGMTSAWVGTTRLEVVF